MRFAAGDPVHVRSLGKGVVREMRNAGKYLVEIKGASLVVAEDQLEAIDRVKSARKQSREPAKPIDESSTPAGVVPVIDLHGMTTIEAEQAIEQFINDALLGGAGEVRVIHGRSGGRLKSAVHARLGRLPSVRGFRLDPRNAGVTIVTF